MTGERCDEVRGNILILPCCYRSSLLPWTKTAISVPLEVVFVSIVWHDRAFSPIIRQLSPSLTELRWYDTLSGALRGHKHDVYRLMLSRVES